MATLARVPLGKTGETCPRAASGTWSTPTAHRADREEQPHAALLRQGGHLEANPAHLMPYFLTRIVRKAKPQVPALTGGAVAHLVSLVGPFI